MSSDDKKPLAVASAIGYEVADMLMDACESLEVAGSIRRKKPLVGDIEIVAMPKGGELNRLLDSLLNKGVITKARYGDSFRWGEKYRGFMFDGMKVEVFSGDLDNIGYIKWLRTGPADANAWVMTKLSWARSPYRAQEGYWWQDAKKLAIADEAEMFRLLGMPYIEPKNRLLDTYERGMAKFKPVQDVKFATVKEAPKQQSMF